MSCTPTYSNNISILYGQTHSVVFVFKLQNLNGKNQVVSGEKTRALHTLRLIIFQFLCIFSVFILFQTLLVAVDMDLYVNIVIVFRALQAVLGRKPSVLMVINITTTQRLQVKYIFFNFKLILHPLLYCLIITCFIFLTSQRPAGRSQQALPRMKHLDLDPTKRKSVSRGPQGQRRAPARRRHLRRLKSLKKPASSLLSQRSASG